MAFRVYEPAEDVVTKRGVARLAGIALVTVAGLAACSGPAKPSSELSKDLDAASSASTLTLAPTTGRRDVVSDVERSPDARRAPAPSRVQLVSHKVTQVTPNPVEATPAPVAVTPSTAVAAAPAAAVPTPATTPATMSRRPSQQQTQPGRYKTEAEVFSNAPFPINP